MAKRISDATFNRAQAARARRLAEEVRNTHPDVARELESLAQDFEERAHFGGQPAIEKNSQ